MPSISHDHEHDLRQERESMNTWRRALKLTLAERPVSDSPVIQSAYPDATSMLVGVDMYCSTLSIDHPVRRAWEDISQFERLHPDVEMIKESFQVTDDYMDEVFIASMAKESARGV